MNDFKFDPGLHNESSSDNTFYTSAFHNTKTRVPVQKENEAQIRPVNKTKAGQDRTHGYALNHRISMCSVIFGYADEELKVLLMDADSQYDGAPGVDPVNYPLALPGCLASPNQTLEISAREMIQELTGDENFFIEQVYSFGNPAKTTTLDEAQPDTWEITIAFFALVNVSDRNPGSSFYLSPAKWYPLSQVSELSPYQNKIVTKALSTLRFEIRHFPIAFELLPEKFTLAQVQSLYEAISGKKLDKRNFRKKLKALNLISPAGEKVKNVIARPSELFVFNRDVYSDSHNSIL